MILTYSKKLNLVAIFAYLFFSISCNTGNEEGSWTHLFNGHDLSGWEHYLSVPDSSFDVIGLDKDHSGIYKEALGAEDPLNVFSVANLEGENVIRISGQVIGNLYTKRSYENYHLSLRFKWGDKKWPWMSGRPKDGGILYHYNRFEDGFSVRHELQIHEGDVGSYWAKNTILEIPSFYTTKIHQSVLDVKKYLDFSIPALSDTMLIFHPDSNLTKLNGSENWQICLANPLNEKESGKWNTLELICYQNHSIHKINDVINFIQLNGSYSRKDKIIKLSKGSIQLQSEGAEIFFKDIKIKKIKTPPKTLTKYLRIN